MVLLCFCSNLFITLISRLMHNLILSCKLAVKAFYSPLFLISGSLMGSSCFHDREPASMTVFKVYIGPCSVSVLQSVCYYSKLSLKLDRLVMEVM